MRHVIALIAAGLVCGVAGAASAQEGPAGGPMMMHAGGGRLGIQVQPMSDQLRAFFGAPADRGVLVGAVEPGSPAEKAGLHAGDVVVAVDGQAVASPRDIIQKVAAKQAGQVASLEIVRARRHMTVATTVRAAPPGYGAGWGSEPSWLWFDGHGVDRLEQRLSNIEQRLEKLEKKAL